MAAKYKGQGDRSPKKFLSTARRQPATGNGWRPELQEEGGQDSGGHVGQPDWLHRPARDEAKRGHGSKSHIVDLVTTLGDRSARSISGATDIERIVEIPEQIVRNRISTISGRFVPRSHLCCRCHCLRLASVWTASLNRPRLVGRWGSVEDPRA